jgi:hypothetical protein
MRARGKPRCGRGPGGVASIKAPEKESKNENRQKNADYCVKKSLFSNHHGSPAKAKRLRAIERQFLLAAGVQYPRDERDKEAAPKNTSDASVEGRIPKVGVAH